MLNNPVIQDAIRETKEWLQHSIIDDMPLKDRLIASYTNTVLTDLETLLSGSDDINKLKDFLAQTWQAISGTTLAYTDLPQYPITKVLCALADYVIEHSQGESRTAKEWLQASTIDDMPLKDRLIASYTNTILTELEALLSGSDDINKLKDFLAQTWQAINGTALAYTALPRHPISKVLYKLAGYVVVHSQDESLGVVKALMPTVHVESTDDTQWPHLGPYKVFPRDKASSGYWKQPVYATDTQATYADTQAAHAQNVASTHVLDKEGDHPVPVKSLKEWCALEKTAASEEKVYGNHYFNTENTDPDYARKRIISSEDRNRVWQHSGHTRAVCDAYKQYQESLCEDNSLLSNLKSLCQRLHFNDAHGGIGQQDNAGGGAYPAIIDFHDYYQCLSDEDKNKIPDELRAEIDTLIELSHNPERNENATVNLETCIGTRREQLVEKMRGAKDVLALIGIEDQHRAALIKVRTSALEEALNALQKRLDEGDYYGCDPLPMTLAVLKNFRVNLSFTHMQDLALLRGLSPEEIRNICSDEGIQRQLVDTIDDIESLVLCFHDLSEEQLGAFLEIMQTPLGERFITSPEQLSVCLLSLIPAKCRLVCLAFKGKFSDIIKRGHHFAWVFEYLTPDQQSAVFDIFQDHLSSIIKSGYDFRDVFQCLNDAQRSIVFDIVQDRLTSIITNGHDFGNVFQYLNDMQRSIVFDAVQDRLTSIITNGHDFHDMLQYLSNAQRSIVFDAFENHLTDIIQTKSQLIMVLQHSNEAQCSTICQRLKEKIPDIIKYGDNLVDVLQHLNEEQCSAVCGALKETFPGIIKRGRTLGEMLQRLNKEQCSAVCDVLEETFLDIIKDAYNLSHVLENLNEAQCSAVCYARVLQKHFPSIVKNGRDFGDVLLSLNDAQRDTVCDAFKEHFPGIIKNGYDLSNVLHNLNEVQQNIVLDACRETLPSMITTAGRLGAVLEQLNKEQCTKVCQQLKEKLAHFINNGEDVSDLLVNLNSDQRNAPFDVLRSHLPRIIKNSFQALKEGRSYGIERGNEVSKLLAHLHPDEYSAVLDVFKEHFSDIIKSANDCRQVFQHLDDAHHSFVFDASKDNLSSIIKNGYEFSSVFQHLDDAHRSLVFDALKDNLSDIIKNVYGFSNVFQHLNNTQRNVAFDVLKEHILSIIQNKCDWYSVRSHLNSDQISVICHLLKGRIESFATHLLEKHAQSTFNLLDEELTILARFSTKGSSEPRETSHYGFFKPDDVTQSDDQETIRAFFYDIENRSAALRKAWDCYKEGENTSESQTVAAASCPSFHRHA